MQQGRAQTVLTSILVVACLAILAWLNGRYVGVGAGEVVLYTIMGLVLLVLGLAAMAGLNLAVDAAVLKPWGFGAVWGAVARGFLIVVPFSLLALLGVLAYDWQVAAPAFVQASLMTSGAAVGTELMRRAAPKTRHLIVSMIVAFVFCMAWTGFTYVFAKVAS